MSTRVCLKRPLIILQVLCLLAVATFLTGCQTTEPQFQDVPPDLMATDAPPPMEPTPSQQPATTPERNPTIQTAVAVPEPTPSAGGAAAAMTEPAAPEARLSTDTFRVGDTVSVDFSGLTPSELPKPHEERIKDDGTITLYLIGTIKAAGKNPGDLQRDLQKEYEKYYKNLVVTVSGIARVFYVGGEVKRPSAYPYLGATTLTKAIQTAGDFTDFAKKSNIQVTRADGSTLKVNFGKAMDDSSLDPPIYPGDTIHVPRRILW